MVSLGFVWARDNDIPIGFEKLSVSFQRRRHFACLLAMHYSSCLSDMWSRSRASEVQPVVYIYNLTFIISSKAYQLVYKNWQTPPYIGTTLLLVQSYKTPPYKNTSVQSPWKIGHERVVQASNVVLWPSKVHGANMEPTWVLSAPDGPHVGPMNLAVRG